MRAKQKYQIAAGTSQQHQTQQAAPPQLQHAKLKEQLTETEDNSVQKLETSEMSCGTKLATKYIGLRQAQLSSWPNNQGAHWNTKITSPKSVRINDDKMIESVHQTATGKSEPEDCLHTDAIASSESRIQAGRSDSERDPKFTSCLTKLADIQETSMIEAPKTRTEPEKFEIYTKERPSAEDIETKP